GGTIWTSGFGPVVLPGPPPQPGRIASPITTRRIPETPSLRHVDMVIRLSVPRSDPRAPGSRARSPPGRVALAVKHPTLNRRTSLAPPCPHPFPSRPLQVGSDGLREGAQ